MSDKLNSLITLNGVFSGYGGIPIIHDVTFELREGDFMAVVGPNGGGKTTLFRTILGLIPLISGKVEVAGESPPKGCRHIGYVPQFGSFDQRYPVLAKEIVAMGLRMHQSVNPFSKKGSGDSVRRAMEFAGVVDFADKRVGDLSGGQVQRTLLARALASEPEVLLLDEPTVSLDPAMRAGVYDILRTVSSEGVTVMMITHDVCGVADSVNRVLHVDRAVSEIGMSELQEYMSLGSFV